LRHTSDHDNRYHSGRQKYPCCSRSCAPDFTVPQRIKRCADKASRQTHDDSTKWLLARIEPQGLGWLICQLSISADSKPQCGRKTLAALPLKGRCRFSSNDNCEDAVGAAGALEV
jgi:hypothetical protein